MHFLYKYDRMEKITVLKKEEEKVKNKFFTRQVCDNALLAQTLHYAQKQRRNEVNHGTKDYVGK